MVHTRRNDAGGPPTLRVSEIQSDTSVETLRTMCLARHRPTRSPSRDHQNGGMITTTPVFEALGVMTCPVKPMPLRAY